MQVIFIILRIIFTIPEVDISHVLYHKRAQRSGTPDAGWATLM